MNVYAESSAVVAWLLGEPEAGKVRTVLAAADVVIAPDLTLVECDRVLIRAVALAEISEKLARQRRTRLNTAAAHWSLLRIGGEIIDRCAGRFRRSRSGPWTLSIFPPLSWPSQRSTILLCLHWIDAFVELRRNLVFRFCRSDCRWIDRSGNLVPDKTRTGAQPYF